MSKMVFGEVLENETVRNTVVAVIVDEQSGEHLCQYWEEYDGLTCLLSGGIEEGEDERAALLREIAEETGYTDITITAQLGEQIESHYIKRDGERFVKIINPYLVTLHSREASETAKEADEKFENLFKTSDEIVDMMTAYEQRTGSSLADHKEILRRGMEYVR